MASETKGLFPAILARHSFYQITNKCPISDERVKEIVDFAITNCPSAYNVQSARAVIVVREKHEKLWDIADETTKAVMPEQVYSQFLAPRIKGFRGGYGSVSYECPFRPAPQDTRQVSLSGRAPRMRRRT